MVSPNPLPDLRAMLDELNHPAMHRLNKITEVWANLLRMERAAAYQQGRADALAEIAQAWGVNKEATKSD